MHRQENGSRRPYHVEAIGSNTPNTTRTELATNLKVFVGITPFQK